MKSLMSRLNADGCVAIRGSRTWHSSSRLLDKDDFDSYLRMASLAPYVPTPPIVAADMMDMAELNENDLHVDLGCGEGHICFQAISQGAKSSLGIDIDDRVLENALGMINKNNPEPMRFIKRDLVEGERWLRDLEAVKELEGANRFVITVYLVEDGLKKIQPYLKELLEQHDNSVIIANEYEIPGWKPSKTLQSMTPLYMYDKSSC